MDSGKYSHYTVRVGKVPGVYTSWEDCEPLVIGYPRVKYKGFHNLADALAFVRGGPAKEKNKSPVNVTDILSPKMATLGVGSSQTGPTQTGMTGTNFRVPGLDAADVEFVPETQGGGFLIVEEMELYLLRVYMKLQLSCEEKGLVLEVYGSACDDEGSAREDAAYKLLDRLLLQTGNSIMDFNYRRLCAAKQQMEAMQNMQGSNIGQRLYEAERDRDAYKEQVEIFRKYLAM
ncbi:hypothetical protein PIB30_001327 [Stylosanthes scabra]|uniref:Ribonuclease H1 N-terminal domain-containing protein n=1 Tax=Stylosanthes scabra TaxID=79078 RepID=A0ABU6Y0T5_9FABA|nr:hypothetical protein [Stylosanthes scabra]